ncbi:hypothetical protein [Polaribacter sp.]|jgi:hypothetical protein|uniref:hypothetical protein n=1 Tax=Polaribacter sp. TaxID=1920175 RepID=UPI003F694FA9
MKKLVAILFFTIVTSSVVSAQKIEMKKVFGGLVFEQQGKTLLLKDMESIMKENKKAVALIQSAKTNQTWSLVLGTTGGALVGFPIGTAIGGGEPEWAIAGVGAALIIATIPIVKGFNRKTKKAVDLYNNGVSSTSYQFQPSFNLKISGTNVGISMNF